LILGTSVSWVGFIPPGFPHNASSAAYSIDGEPSVFFPLKGLPLDASATLSNQIFFTTPRLPARQHSLVVTHNGSFLQTPLTLDCLYVTTSMSAIFGDNLASNSTTLDPAPEPSTGNSWAISQKHRPPVAGIVGGVIGAVTLFVLALLLLACKRRQLRSKLPLSREIQEYLEVSPFTYHISNRGIFYNPLFQIDLGPHIERGAVTKPGYPSSLPAVGSVANEPQPILPSAPHWHTVPPYDVPDVATETRTIHGGRDGPHFHSVLHQDSGLRLGDEIMVQDVPPTYTAI
jgi:hypothetical protein